MKIIVTGADGYVGRGLVAALAAAGHGLVLVDRVITLPPAEGVEQRPGDLTDAGFIDTLFTEEPDAVVHLASVPGSFAETRPELGWRANAEATFALMQRARGRFVFASSIAVYGDVGLTPVTPETPLSPQMSYGVHKLMGELLLSDLTRRGALSGVSLRLPGLVARPMTETGHGSAFMSRVIQHAARGEAYACPVPETAMCWWMSRDCCVAAILHALATEGGPSVVQLPVLRASVGAVAEAAAKLGGYPLRVTWGDDATLERLFGAMPPVDQDVALSLGYRPDPDLDALVRAALVG
ncbi:NAD-dependent epimerase/dehydratase family protein [Falsirhodobacter sp. 1013]|uniref:NAD-dependent epimerase/dehydratase family protein n=1 Tax=Falsirhodobacter sp. 1013 TaxID=3417566 RepID=UPI003EBEF4A0